MARQTLLKLSCDNPECTNSLMTDITKDPKEVLPSLQPWRGVIDGDAVDDGKSIRWYCSTYCLTETEN